MSCGLWETTHKLSCAMASSDVCAEFIMKHESKLPMWVHECDALRSMGVVTTILPTFCSKIAKKY